MLPDDNEEEEEVIVEEEEEADEEQETQTRPMSVSDMVADKQPHLQVGRENFYYLVQSW